MMSQPAKQHAIRATRETDPLQGALTLMRIHDFLSLILSYPMRVGYEHFLEQWIKDVSWFFEAHSWDRIRLRTCVDKDADFDSTRKRIEQLLSESPVRHVHVMIPRGVKALKQVPQPILLLATQLAVHQLTQTLTSDRWLELKKIQNIWFSTRHDTEKRTVVEHIQANSLIRAAFDDLQLIDLNRFDDKTERELQVLNLKTRPEQATSSESPKKDDYALVAKNDIRSRHLVLLVDGDGDKKLEPHMLSLPIKRDSGHVVVFITTQSSARQNYELSKNVDLTIKTESHLLPWELFCKNVGSELLHSDIDIQRIAVQIVQKCGGHLLAIIFMAKSLKHVKDVRIWERALQKLLYHNREAIVNAFFHIIWVNVTFEWEKLRLMRCLIASKFQDLIMSHDQLFAHWFSEQLVDTEGEAKRILQKFMESYFLLPFEGPRGYYIQLAEDVKIILHAFGEEIIENLDEGALASTVSNLQVLDLSKTHMQNLYTANALHYLEELNLEGCMLETLPKAIFKLQKLKTLSLEHCSQLLELPPLIAKLENLKTLRLTGCKRLQKLPPEICELQNLEMFDLSDTQIIHLPQLLNLPILRSLLLGNNLNLMKIPSSFFDNMPLLSIVDLSRTSIHELPSSIFNLRKLREFYLRDCELFGEIPTEISRLKNITTLDLDGTLITHLPNEIQELTRLERLSISLYNDSRCEVIPTGVLSELTHLKVLKIDVNSDNEWWFKNVRHIIAEINGLLMLRALDMYIPKVEFLALMKRDLPNFRFIIGHHKPRMISRVPPAIEVIFKESSPSLKFVNGKYFSDNVKHILSEAWAFFLDRHMKINNLAQFGLKNLKQLRLCILAECNEMQTIVDMDECGAYLSLNESFCMRFLTIFNMKNLQSIVNKPILDNPIFRELKLLALHTCPELTTIFTMNFPHSLVNLEELIVEDCPKVSSIISCPSSERTTEFLLPRLRKVSLLFVPELASISDGVCIGRNLEEMGLYYCPKLQSLSTAELSSKKLRVIRGEAEWWEALKWIETEWGQEDPRNKFSEIFYPIDEDLDIFTQLTTYDELTPFNRENDSGES